MTQSYKKAFFFNGQTKLFEWKRYNLCTPIIDEISHITDCTKCTLQEIGGEGPQN